MFAVGLDVDKIVFTEKILLCAGNFCINSPLVLNTLGKIYLKQYNLPEQSAGNLSFSTKATAITKNTSNSYINLPLISEHVPNHKSKFTNTELGYFLAGLIEGNGWFSEKELHLIFTENDITLAYFIKKQIGYGNVYKIATNKSVKYICTNQKGLIKILKLINGKLVSNLKYDQLIKFNYQKQFNYSILPPLNSINLDNYWLAGFTQANGCFNIRVLKSKTQNTGFSVRLEFYLKQDDLFLLNLFFNTVKMGNIYYYDNGIWCYKSSGFKTAAMLINYYDFFNLFAGKYVSYLKFRKVYLMITKGKHLEEKGINKIKSIATKGSSETSTQEV